MNNGHSSISRHLFPRLNTLAFLLNGAYREDILSLVEQGVGGFVLFEGSVDDCAETISLLRRETPHQLLFAADCEYGLTMRFRRGIAYPSMMGLGEGNDLATTEEVARAIAMEMAAIGLDWNFAPVLDVNSNPANPIINIRSFGESPEIVAEHGAAYIRGMQSGGIIACGKHFPGHGDTTVDSHIDLPCLERSREGLERLELLPFRRAIDEGVLTIMSGHIAVPSLDSGKPPASLSPSIL
ncbi:MAG: glycoside hydrolase family 3 N-terminal domain-containing protein, partial [Candidatus Kapaibacterium sp.]